MTNISDRIAILIKEKGISTRALEQAIGCSNGVISRCISKGTDISSLWVSKIIEIHNDINPTWLLTGKGDIYYNTSSTTTQTTELSSLLALIREKEEIIREQDREIGRLEERIRQMTIEKENMYRMRPFPILQMSGRRIYCYHTPVMENEAYPLSSPMMSPSQAIPLPYHYIRA